jgi:RHH-type proline utilization regulon transcriptional repressor/proline dehydrogenase/delta 1-pyrroline-5-carboxylate dehydrogenase
MIGAMDAQLEKRIAERGAKLFARIRGGAPTLFNRGWWAGKVLDLAMSNEAFKIQLFRFVDCLPALKSGDALARHIDEYFGESGAGLPPVLRFGAKGLSLGEGTAGRLLGNTLRTNIERMGRIFIAGSTPDEAVRTLKALRRAGYAFTVDILGEATVSEEEAAAFERRYLELLDHLDRESEAWSPLSAAAGTGPAGERLDWGYSPMINLSVKPTAFYSQIRPADFEGSVQGICGRLRPVLARAREIGAHINLDMEQYRVKDITLEVFRRLRSETAFRDYPHFGLVLQAYLTDTEEDLEDLLAWSEKEDLPLSIRLVKGAYWDYETVIAGQNGWRVPVFTSKAATDAAFERLAARILENHERCYLACASHNVRTVAAVMEKARALGAGDDVFEFQVLFGMAEPVRRALLKEAGRVRLYAPFGELLPGISYLVRRLLENTSNESFVRRRFAEEADEKRLLEDPAVTLAGEGRQSGRPSPPSGKASVDPTPLSSANGR